MNFKDRTGINRRFSQAAKTYDNYAVVQNQVAQNLANQIVGFNPDAILEIGCGTGLLTTRLVDKFPNAKLMVTDISEEMLAITKQKLEHLQTEEMNSHSAEHGNCIFKLMNPEVEIEGKYDLIISSMAVHWFENIPQTLESIRRALNPGGVFYYSTIGPDCFAEWIQTLRSLNLPIGLRLPPELPGIINKTTISISYGTAHNFLKGLKNTGAYSPKPGYVPLSPLKLRAAMRELEKTFDATISWHIHYGKLINN